MSREITYLLESGSDRIGSLDFQVSATEYQPRIGDNASLDDMQNAAERVNSGMQFSPVLLEALFHGTEVGGARPKATITDGDRKYVAKFSVSNDAHDVVRTEYLCMTLAEWAGLDVARVKLTEANGRSVLMVERFDRERVPSGWTRRSMVSGLTVPGLDERWAREASYPAMVDELKKHAVDFRENATELYRRMVFNVLIGNTDDNARNHAFFLDRGDRLKLTPAYDICALVRSGGEAGHSMGITRKSNLSRLGLCVESADDFGIERDEALEIIRELVDVVADQTEQICVDCGMPDATRKLLWRRSILNPDIFSGLNDLDPFV